MIPRAFYTSPIFYVNASPHIGHLYSMVLTDVAHRWSKFMGRQSIMSTGTDEHGMKVAAAAQLAHQNPQPFVDNLSQKFKTLADVGGIDYTRFIRTTDSDHIDEAKNIWNLLKSKGYIYKGTHKGWYCLSDETFYPETELEKAEDGTLLSKESGNKVEWFEEENYFFKLSELQKPLLELFRSNKKFVRPLARHNQILNQLELEPLQDLSISRPSERCPWGIEVPDDSKHTMYVWFEALINYYTVNKSLGGDWWPATHIVGKDIMRFHCVYWPAFLIAAELAPPKQVIVHGHWTLEGTKMSKSKKNIVDPFEAMQKYGRDTVRYALIHDSVLGHDSPFSYARLVERHNVNLVNKLGNLVARVGGPKFDIKSSLESGFASLEQNKHPLVSQLKTLLEDCDRHAEAFEFSRIPQAVNDVCMAANTAFQEAEPWAAADPRPAVALAAETCRLAAIVLQPVTPEHSERLLDRLGVHPDRRTSEWAKFAADKDFGLNIKGSHPLDRVSEEEKIEA